MGFFDESPLMREVTLPRNETGRVGDCPTPRLGAFDIKGCGWCDGLHAVIPLLSYANSIGR